MYKQLTLASDARVPRTESTDIHLYESVQSKLYGKWGVGVGGGGWGKMKLIVPGRLNLIRQPEFLAAEEACMAVFWPSPDIE